MLAVVAKTDFRRCVVEIFSFRALASVAQGYAGWRRMGRLYAPVGVDEAKTAGDALSAELHGAAGMCGRGVENRGTAVGCCQLP